MLNLTLVVAGLKELVIDDLGGTARDASLFFSIEMVAYIVFAPVWGLLSDRWGRRRGLVTLGFLLCAPLYALYSIVESVTALLTLRFVQGAFAVMGWSSLMAIVLDQVDEKRRGRFMGLMGGALIFGVSLGAPLGGYVSRHLGARAPLQLSAVLFLLMALASLVPPRAGPAPPAGGPPGDRARPARAAAAPPALALLLRGPLHRGLLRGALPALPRLARGRRSRGPGTLPRPLPASVRLPPVLHGPALRADGTVSAAPRSARSCTGPSSARSGIPIGTPSGTS